MRSEWQKLNVNLGVMMTALLPLGTGGAAVYSWADEIEDNVRENQAQIAELIEKIDDAADRTSDASQALIDRLDALIRLGEAEAAAEDDDGT